MPRLCLVVSTELEVLMYTNRSARDQLLDSSNEQSKVVRMDQTAYSMLVQTLAMPCSSVVSQSKIWDHILALDHCVTKLSSR